VAGGVGATLTSAGETRHMGAELSLRGSLQEMGVLDGKDVFFRSALTFIPQAEYTGRRTSAISGFSGVSVSGNRLPYAPEWIAAAAVGYARGDWLTAQIEAQDTGPQFTDDLNTRPATADGQRGRMDGFTVINATVNVTPASGPVTVYATVKNLFDEVYIVDRSRGILPGAPRLVQVGLSYAF
jgi:Fe(3+) dicitrate transport protein